MPTLAEVRSQYPQYDDLSDGELAARLHKSFYSDMPKEEFDKKIGFGVSQEQPEQRKFTGYLDTQKKMAGEALDLMKSGISDIMHPGEFSLRPSADTGLFGGIGKGIAKTGLGALGYTLSPISSAIDQVAGQPLEYLTGIPREYTDFAAGLLTPGGQAKSAASLPGFGRAISAAERTGIDVPRAMTSTSPTIKAGSQALAVAPYVGTPLREAVQAVPKKISSRIEGIADEFAGAAPENVVGGGIEQRLSGAAEKEAAAGQAAAKAADEAAAAKYQADNEAATQQWEQANQAREQAIADRQAQAEQQATQTFGRVNPIEMSEDAISQVRAAEGQARRAKEAAYDRVNELNARVSKNAFNDVRQTAEGALKDAGFTIDQENFPNASRLMRELGKLTREPGEPPPNVPPRLMVALEKEYKGNVPPDVLEGLGFPGGTGAKEPDFGLMGRHAPTTEAPDVSIQGVEQLRKRIGQMAFDPKAGADDRAASNIIKNAFDDWYHNATESHLMGGDQNALDVIRAAREANADWRTRFGYNHGSLPPGGERRRAAQLLNRMVTGDIGPEEVARNIVGAKPGTRPVSAPLYDAVSGAIANPAQFRTNVRGAYFDRIAGEGRAPRSIAGDINEFLPTRMGERLLEPHEHDLMRGYGELGQSTTAAEAEARNIAKATKPKPGPAPKPTKVEPGKAVLLAKEVLGRNRSDEGVFGKVDAMARNDVKGFARTWGAMSDANRNEFRSTLLRNLGGGTGDDFTASKFVKNWENYSKQAKTVMFGREHRDALDDFHTIAKQYGDNIKKYGNPSGTAQVAAWHKLAMAAPKTAIGVFSGAGTLAAFNPIGAAIAGLGLRRLSHILARPEGAQQVVRWNRLAEAYKRSPNTRTLLALQATTRGLNKD